MHRWTLVFKLRIVVIFILFGLQACKSKPKNPKPQQSGPTIVDVIVASPQSISNTIVANGNVVANEYVELHPEVSGRLIYLNVPEGKYIAQGTVIARINDADLRAQLEKSRVQLDLAQKTEERDRQLLAVSGINQSDYDLAVNQVNGFKADITYTQALIDKTVIKAPFSGIVGLRQISPGAFVSPSTVIATIQQINRMKIDFTIPEEYGNIIKKGASVEVEVDAAQQNHSEAVIIAVEPQVNQTTRNLKVRAVLQNAKANPGAFVKVYVEAAEDRNAIKVPTNSLIPDDKNNQIILVKNGKADFVSVQTGVRESNNVEITKGVNVGDTVVITGVLFARPKSPVRVRSVKTIEQLTKLNQ